MLMLIFLYLRFVLLWVRLGKPWFGLLGNNLLTKSFYELIYFKNGVAILLKFVYTCL